MQRFPLGGLDLNLLKVLYALAVKGNMTQAGDYIGLSQPAMSHALKRLRAITGDRLFLRNARGLTMTRHCADIFPGVKVAAKSLVFSKEPLILHKTVQLDHQFIENDRLHQVVVRASTERGDRRLDRGVCGNHQEQCVRP